jgi:hypothetical protein
MLASQKQHSGRAHLAVQSLPVQKVYRMRVSCLGPRIGQM